MTTRKICQRDADGGVAGVADEMADHHVIDDALQPADRCSAASSATRASRRPAPSGPSTMERSYLAAAGWAGRAGATDAESAAAGFVVGRTASSEESVIRDLTRAGSGASTSRGQRHPQPARRCRGDLHPTVKRQGSSPPRSVVCLRDPVFFRLVLDVGCRISNVINRPSSLPCILHPASACRICN